MCQYECSAATIYMWNFASDSRGVQLGIEIDNGAVSFFCCIRVGCSSWCSRSARLSSFQFFPALFVILSNRNTEYRFNLHIYSEIEITCRCCNRLIASQCHDDLMILYAYVQVSSASTAAWTATIAAATRTPTKASPTSPTARTSTPARTTGWPPTERAGGCAPT